MRMILIIFQKKFLWSKWTISGPKMVYPHYSGSAVRIFLKFAQSKWPIGRWNLIIMVCTKKNLVMTNGPWKISDQKMAHTHNSESALRISLRFCRMKGANRYIIHSSNLIFLAFRPFFTIWLGMVKLIHATVNWILNSQDIFSL